MPSEPDCCFCCRFSFPCPPVVVRRNSFPECEPGFGSCLRDSRTCFLFLLVHPAFSAVRSVDSASVPFERGSRFSAWMPCPRSVSFRRIFLPNRRMNFPAAPGWIYPPCRVRNLSGLSGLFSDFESSRRNFDLASAVLSFPVPPDFPAGGICLLGASYFLFLNQS